jgi:membrane-associated protease RseP (regulator of RpoE activity)
MTLFWLILFLLGALTYWAVRRSATGLTRTPIWLLWLVMMMPAFIWTAWVLMTGNVESMPILLLVVPFLVCPFIYWMLVQMGRPMPSDRSAPPSPTAAAAAAPPPTVPGGSTIRPMTKTEETALQNCFPWSVFYLQNIEYRPQALVCRGKLRTSPEVAYRTIRENIEAQFGDRFLVVFQEGMNGSPFFALVSNPLITKRNASQDTPTRPAVMLGLLGATLLTTTLAGSMGVTGLTTAELPQDFTTFLTGLPYAIALLAILGTHEFGHYCAARFHRVRATLPYFIPVPPAAIFPFGTFGAFIQMKSPVPNRKALFDIGIAGPLSGLLVTIPLLLWGLTHSAIAPVTDESGILNFTSLRPTGSLLLLLLSKLALGSQLTPESSLDLHPVAIAGCLGLIVTALNLMPVGQLDGGHIVHAMFGQRTGALIGQVTRLLVLGLALVQPEFLLWAILLFFIPAVDEPALNDVSELNNARDAVGLVSLVLLVMIVLPAPPTLIQFLY